MRTVLLFLLVALPSGIAGGEPLREMRLHAYRLTPESFYEEGCYAPCMCPILLGEDLEGRFVLVPRGVVEGFLVHAVSAASWRVFGPHGFTVTGSGTYRISLGRPRLQRMELDLSVDGREPERFESGLVPVERAFPMIDITVSMNGMYCYDTVFSISGSPVRFARGPVRDVVPGVSNTPTPAIQPTTWGRIKSLYPGNY